MSGTQPGRVPGGGAQSCSPLARAALLRKPAHPAPVKPTSNAHTSVTHHQRELSELIMANFRTKSWLTVSQKTGREQRLEFPGVHTSTHFSPSPRTGSRLPAAPSAMLNSAHAHKDDPGVSPFLRLALVHPWVSKTPNFSKGWVMKAFMSQHKAEIYQCFLYSQARQQTCLRLPFLAKRCRNSISLGARGWGNNAVKIT